MDAIVTSMEIAIAIMSHISKPRASSYSVSLFPYHFDIIQTCASERRLRGNAISPTIQFILEEWQELRGMLAFLSPEEQEQLRQRYMQESRILKPP